MVWYRANRGAWLRYGAAIVLPLLAAVLRAWFLDTLETRAIFITFFPGVTIAALYGGLLPGLLATVLSAGMVAYYWMEPAGFAIGLAADRLSLVIFLLNGAVISGITEERHRARAKASEARAQARLAAERQHAAEEMHRVLEREAQARRENEERLHLAQQVARIASFDWNLQTGVNRWTPELEAMYGLPPGGFAGTQQAWEERVHPDDRAAFARRIHEAIESGSFQDDWRVIWPDGTLRWMSGSGRIFNDDSGKPLRMIGVNFDITRRKRAEQELRQLTGEL